MLLHTLLTTAAGAEALPEWARVAAAIVPVSVAAGGAVFLQGVTHPFIYGVQSGLVKLHYLDADGEEWIKSFIPEGRFCASLAALEQGGRTSFMATALEPAELERVDYALLDELASRHMEWARALFGLMRTFAARKEQREKELLTLTPEGRYRSFLAAEPALATRIPQKEMARHLGVTPVGLNRIVMRVRREG